MTLTDDMRGGGKTPQMPRTIETERFVLESASEHREGHYAFAQDIRDGSHSRQSNLETDLGTKLNLSQMAMNWTSQGFGTYLVKDKASGDFIGAARIGYDMRSMSTMPEMRVAVSDRKFAKTVVDTNETKAEIGFAVAKAATQNDIQIYTTDATLGRDIGMSEFGGFFRNTYFDANRASHKPVATV